MNHKGVCKTAPATPGLSIIGIRKKHPKTNMFRKLGKLLVFLMEEAEISTAIHYVYKKLPKVTQSY